MTLPVTEPLKSLEDVLGSARGFGDSNYIHQQKQQAYERRLVTIASQLRVAGELAQALHSATAMSRDRVVGSTVVRCAVQHALTKLEIGVDCALSLDECKEVFEAAIAHVESGLVIDPLQVGMPNAHRLGSAQYHGLIWSEEHDDDVFGRMFRKLIDENYAAPLCVPTADEIHMLQRGARLLSELVPLLAESALSHARVIAPFPPVGSWNGRASSSQFRVSGTIFLHRSLLISPWWVAEHLLHESLHQKLYDFRHGHSLLSRDYQRPDAPSVCALWNTYDVDRGNYWDVHRVIAACHVYVHLALLATIAEERHLELEAEFGKYNDPISTTSSRAALSRARYLAEQLKRACWTELGLAGQALTDWLISVLDILDPAPPPPGASLHLVLELYRREISLIKAVLERSISHESSGSSAYAADQKALARLAANDATTAIEILRAANSGSDAEAIERELHSVPGGEFAAFYPTLRERIAAALSDASNDGYTLPHPESRSRNLNDEVRQMVKSASRSLDMIVRGQIEEVASAT